MDSRSYKNYSAKWRFMTEEEIDAKNDIEDAKELAKQSQLQSHTELQTNDDPIVQEYSLKVDFYKDDQYLYSLSRNNYRTEDDDVRKFLLLEWFEINNQVVHIFNINHSIISIINADTGQEIHHDNLYDVFITDYELFDNREYLYLGGWFWTPLPVRVIYHIPTFLITPNYEPTYIECEENHQEKHGISGTIDLYGCETVKEFLNKKDAIFKNIEIKKSTELFNTHRSTTNDDTLLNIFCSANVKNEDIVFLDNSKEKLEKLLQTDQTEFYIESWGNISGKRLRQFDYILIKKIIYSDIILDNHLEVYSRPMKCDTSNLTFLVPKMLFSNFIKNLPMDVINLKFSIYCGENIPYLTINISQQLTWNGETSQHENIRRYNVDPAKKCKIIIN